MYLIAHEGYSLLAAEIVSYGIYLIKKRVQKNGFAWNKWGWLNFSVITLLIAAVGPDIIDKSISYSITGHSRYIAHSLMFDLIICGFIVLIFRKKPKIWRAFIFGWQMHILLDVKGFMPWFYPFKTYNFPIRTQSFITSLFTPYNYINEIFGFIALVFVIIIYYKRGFLRFPSLANKC